MVIDLGGEFRRASRALARKPGHALLAIAILSGGLGLTMFMFGAIEAYILRPLPYSEPHRLVHIDLARPATGQDGIEFTLHDYLDLKARQTSLEEIAAFYMGTVNVGGNARPERYDGAFITAETFQVIGAEPLLGRAILASDNNPGADPVAMLSYDLWINRFGGATDVIGQGIRLNSGSATIIGVMPEGFHFPVREKIWVPMQVDPAEYGRGEGYDLKIIGRLGDDVTVGQARSEIEAIVADLARRYPDTNHGTVAVVRPYAEEYVDKETRAMLFTMLATVLLVLFIACANVANLTMVRTMARQRELAIRAALGAGRRRLLLNVLVECFLISIAATTIGTFLARWGGELTMEMIHSQADAPPYWVEMRMGWTDLALAVSAALATTLLAGLLPALRASSSNINKVLRNGGWGLAGTPLGRISRALVIGEVALACVVLICAGLMTRSIVKLGDVDIGADTQNILTGRIGLFEGDYPEASDVASFLAALDDTLAAIPSATGVTLATSLPGTLDYSISYEVEGHETQTGELRPAALSSTITPRYFEVFGVSLLEGRSFTRGDDLSAPRVALVNATFAERATQDGAIVGRRLRLGETDDPDTSWTTVVGVVADVLQDEIDDPVQPTVYLPIAQDPPRFVSIALRTESEPLAHAELMREAVASLDPNLPIYWVRSLEQWIDEERFGPRLLASLFTIFAAIGLLLAAGGLYAILANEVAYRASEIGVRRALGASGQRIVGLIVGRGVAQLGLGLGIGIVLALGFARLLAGALFGVSPWDPVTFVGVAGVISVVAVLATSVPAWRAISVNPISLLNTE
ncbi:MAG: ABC transporter permease [bacterium]|nr:ABC transporter permease [bacterium]